MTKSTEMPHEIDERYMVPALARGLALLEAFGPEKPALTLVEMAKAIGTTRSSAYRLVYTLTELGFLERDEDAKTYRLGSRVLGLGFSFLSSHELVEVARSHLETLSDAINCSAHLGVLDGTEIVYLARVAVKRALTSGIQVGSRLPAHATSIGRAILMTLPPDEVRERFAGLPLKPFTAETPTTLDGLVQRLAQDRALGYALSRSAFEPGIASVAAPVYGADGIAQGAINITTPESSLHGDELETRIKDAVLDAAADISRWLGYRPVARRTA